MNIFFSNRIEKLYQELKIGIFARSENAFERRMVIVPSPAIKSWLMLEMAKDEQLTIAIGVEILLLDEAIEKLIPKRKLPCTLELGLMIEVEIKKMITEDFAKWQKLAEYLKISNDTFSNRANKRVIALSEKLASLFLQYGTFGGEMISQMKEQNSDDFQIELWKRLFVKKDLPYLQNEFKENSLHPSLKNSPLVNIHLFSLSFLSKAHFDFFSKISLEINCNYYFLSPCQAFWSDIRSTKEQSRLNRFLQNKGKTTTSPLELDEYLRDQNPLLANFGKLGRQMAKMIEESEAETDANYVISSGIEDHPQYEDFYFDEVELDHRPFTLLTAIQADLTLLRNPGIGEKIVLEDDSIQVHVASSKSREVQILYDTLLKLISENEDKERIGLNEIIVMAPDIMDYEPFIHAVFGSDESLLKYHLMDLEMPAQNPLIREFLHLIFLAQEKFCADALLNLLAGAYFQKNQQLSIGDVDKIRKWLISSDLRWGHDAVDRNEWLLKNGSLKGLIEHSETGTLSYAQDLFITSLTVEKSLDDRLNVDLERFPIDHLEPSDALLLGKFITLSNALKNDLKVLNDGTKMSLEAWSAYLHCIVLAYFGIDETDPHLSTEELALLHQFDEFSRISENFKVDVFSFETIHSKLMAAFTKEKVDFQKTELNSVRFCSMLPMRAIPASIVVLMGMNQDEFPRIDSKNSLDLCLNNELSDYRPTRADYDRYLFLESLLSARKYFILSYIGYSPMDASKRTSSLLVQELISAIDEGYLIGVNKFSKVAIKNHPFNAYDKAYFKATSELVSFSKLNYQLATHFYHIEKLKKHQIIEHFEADELVTSELPELVIDLKELTSFARNPLKTYFNKSLGIYLREEEEFKEDEDFAISPMDLASIKKSGLKIDLKDVFNLVEKKGNLPTGVFGQVAKEKIASSISSLKENLKGAEILPQEIFKVDFLTSVDIPVRLPNGDWQLPALTVKYSEKLQIKIIGTFNEVSEKGLVLHAENNKVDVIKIWPLALVFMNLIENNTIAEKKLIFAKCGKVKVWDFDNADKLLHDYLSYYFKGLKNPSPIIPEWAFDFVYQEENSLQNKMDKSLDDDFNPIYNDYLHWMINKDKLTFCESFAEDWKTTATDLYQNIFEKWYTKKE